LGVETKGELIVTKKKSLLIILCIIGVSALVFSQCIGTSGNGGGTAATGQDNSGLTNNGSDSTDGEKVIKASVAMEAKEFEMFTRLAKHFSELHDGVTIQVENVPAGEAYEKWKKAGQIGEAPDLMLLDNHWVQEFAALGFLQPVGEFFSTDQQNSRISKLMNQVKWNGYIWGVPKDVDPYILAWNKKAASEIKLEQAPETADELLAWNKLLLKPEDGRLGVYLNPNDPYAFITLSSSLTSAWLGKDKVWPDEADAQKKLESFLAPQEDAWTGKSYPKNYPVPSAAWSPWEQLSKGQIAAMITTVSAFKSQSKDGTIAMASIPGSLGSEKPVWLKGRSFTVSSRTPYAKLLMDWIKEMTTPEMEIKFWEDSGMLPAQIPAYSLAPLRNDEHIHSFDWLISQGRVLPTAAETSKSLYELQVELQKLWKGDTGVKELVASTSKSWHLEEKKQ
jgi:ABC-type glycerol-3-phosphate transport system substrate-binding protein